MPTVHPFAGVQFASSGDLSALVAPPYDVLDAEGKRRLLAKDPRNIVAIDLPHTPAKELGPPEAYAAAGDRYRSLLRDGTLKRAGTPTVYAYRQSFTSQAGTQIRRSGMCACVDTVPFGPRPGGGILPHEETFSGPKEDRMALMKATRAQLSPIFGLHADERGLATALLTKVMASRPADVRATTDDGTLHEVWNVTDSPTIRAYQDALAGEDIFIADGHHRYNTGLNYLKALETQGAVPPDHPARRCMMVLIGMSDPGLVIWPTHRVLGGMAGYSWDAFQRAASTHVRTRPVPGGVAALGAALESDSSMGPRRFGLLDAASGAALIAAPLADDPLAGRFPAKPRAWRDLSVAFCQHVLVEQICQPALNSGNPVKWAFPHTIKEVQDIVSGAETGAGGGKQFAQLAVLVNPTPLDAVKDVSRAGELMPQKSTFFYPKLATGLFINPLE